MSFEVRATGPFQEASGGLLGAVWVHGGAYFGLPGAFVLYFFFSLGEAHITPSPKRRGRTAPLVRQSRGVEKGREASEGMEMVEMGGVWHLVRYSPRRALWARELPALTIGAVRHSKKLSAGVAVAAAKN